MKYKLYFSIISFFLFTQLFFAQENVKKYNELNFLINEYQKLFFNSKEVVDNVFSKKNHQDYNLWNSLKNDAYFSSYVLKDSLSFVNDQRLTNVGLKWVSDFTHNLSMGISDEEDLYFKSRISTGLDWSILGEGSYFKNKKDLGLISIQSKKDSLYLLSVNNEFSSRAQINFVNYIFDLHKLELLNSLKQILELRSNYYHNLYQAELVLYAKKLKADNELDKVSKALDLNKAYLANSYNNQLIEKYWNLPFSFSELPSLKSLDASNLLVLESEINQLQNDYLLKNKSNSESPSLRAKFRYNYYTSGFENGRYFPSVGASLSIPINFGKDQITESKIKSNNLNIQIKKENLKSILFQDHFEYYALKNNSDELENELLYIKALLDNEIKVYETNFERFSPEKYIQYAIDLLTTQNKLIEVRNQLCLEYLKFLNATETNIKVQNTVFLENESAKMSYLWSDFFANELNDNLIDLLKLNNINLLMFSPSESSEEKIEDFVDQAKNNKIELFRMISENTYASLESGPEKLLKKLESINVKQFSGIHLNIEPHTFDDYHRNVIQYTDKLNDLYLITKKWCDSKNLKLSVSVPMHLSLKNAAFLKDHNISVYIMAYENSNQEKLLKRTKDLRSVLNGQFVWVLRLNDFENKQNLDKEMEVLKSNNIEQFGFYDVSMLRNIYNEN